MGWNYFSIPNLKFCASLWMDEYFHSTRCIGYDYLQYIYVYWIGVLMGGQITIVSYVKISSLTLRMPISSLSTKHIWRMMLIINQLCLDLSGTDTVEKHSILELIKGTGNWYLCEWYVFQILHCFCNWSILWRYTWHAFSTPIHRLSIYCVLMLPITE